MTEIIKRMNFRNEIGYTFYSFVITKTQILNTKGEGGQAQTENVLEGEFDDDELFKKIKKELSG